MRMAAHDLLVNRPCDRHQVAGAALLDEQREEERLEQEGAKLVDQLGVIGGESGIRDLISLLDRVRHDRLGGLRPVPRAVPAEAFRQLLEVDESAGELVAVGHPANRLRWWFRFRSPWPRAHSPE